MTNLRALTVPAFILVSLTGVMVSGAAHAETETRKVDAFREIALGGSGRLEITVGPEQSVQLEADPEVLRHVTTKVSGGTLSIGYEDESFFSRKSPKNKSIVARVTLPKLEGATLAGSGDMRITGLAGGNTDITVAGSGNVRAEGKLDQLDLMITGSGEAEMDKLDVQDAEVTINGSGDVTLMVSRELATTINGSGSIRYIGNPKDVDSDIRGSGSIRKAD